MIKNRWNICWNFLFIVDVHASTLIQDPNSFHQSTSLLATISKMITFFYWLFFRQRLELMREMYQNDAEVSPSSPDPAKQEVNLNADPFYDRFPW